MLSSFAIGLAYEKRMLLYSRKPMACLGSCPVRGQCGKTMTDGDDEWKDMPTWMDTEKLSELIHIPKRTLEGFRRKGIGPEFVKVSDSQNAKVFYRKHDVVGWLQSRIDISRRKPK